MRIGQSIFFYKPGQVTDKDEVNTRKAFNALIGLPRLPLASTVDVLHDSLLFI